MNTGILPEFEINEGALIRAVLPANTVKRLSRLIGCPLKTADHFVYRGVSASRRREVARRLLLEMDAQDIARNSVRRRLIEWTGGSLEVRGLVTAIRGADPVVVEPTQLELAL